MKRTPFAANLLTLAALILPVTVGCGGGQEQPSAQQASPAASQTAGASGSQGSTAGQPASTAKVIDGAGTEPAQSVAIFLDSLRRGDEKAANSVLTSKAREEMAKTAYALQPLGTPEGQYEIGRVGFPYEEKDVALVECTWKEPAVPGEPQLMMDIVCEVHQESEGWRISGIGVTLTGTEDALVLDFENAASLQATIDAATGQTAAPNEGNQPAANQSTGVAGASPPGLPELPSYPNGATLEAAPTQQIALPPINGAPVNR